MLWTPGSSRPSPAVPRHPGDCARSAGVELYTEPTSSQILMDTSIDGAWVFALLTIYVHKPSHAAIGTSFKCYVTIPGNLQDGVIALLGERTLHDGCVGGIGLKVHNTLLPVGIEGPVSWELGTWES